MKTPHSGRAHGQPGKWCGGSRPTCGHTGRWQGRTSFAPLISLACGLAFPRLVQVIIDDVVRGQRSGYALPAICLAGAFLLRDLFNSLRIIIDNVFEQNVIFDMRRDVFARLQRLPVGYFDQRASGDFMTRVIEDVNSVERVLIDGTEQGTVALLSVAAVLVILFCKNATLAAIALAPVPLLVAGVLWYTLTAHRRYRAQRRASSAMNAFLMDSLQGVRQIKSFGRQQHEDDRFAAPRRRPAAQHAARDENLGALFAGDGLCGLAGHGAGALGRRHDGGSAQADDWRTGWLYSVPGLFLRSGGQAPRAQPDAAGGPSRGRTGVRYT